MEIRLDHNAFAAALAPLQDIVGPTATMPVLSHILLTARDGRLDLAATNLDLWLTSSCDAAAAGDGGIAVPGRKSCARSPATRYGWCSTSPPG
jgi:DNA polymerase-3 subunit beta